MILPQNIIFSKHQNKAEINNLDDSEVPNCDFPGVRTSAASMTSTALMASMTSMTSTAAFHQKNAHPDGWIISTTKMTNTSAFLRNRASKIQLFSIIILIPFLLEAVEASLHYFFKHRLMKLKFPNLLNPL